MEEVCMCGSIIYVCKLMSVRTPALEAGVNTVFMVWLLSWRYLCYGRRLPW
jgi:ABC-type enterobactin transport system permease subunit